MRKLFCIFIVCLSVIQDIQGQSNETCRIEAIKLLRVIEKFHVNPPVLDSAFSSDVFNEFIMTLDPNRIYFSKEDYDVLNTKKYSVINGLNEKSWNFFNLTRSVYIKRLWVFDSLINSLLKKPLELIGNDYYSTEGFYGSIKNGGYTKRARKWLTYKVLNQISNARDSVNMKNYSVLEETCRKKVLKLESRKIVKRLNQPNSIDNYLFESFLNSIASTADAHSNYMSAFEKKMFESDLEPEKLSFGLQLDINQYDELVISGLLPGGAAWKSNAIRKGDVIIGFRIAHQQKIDIDSIDLEETNSYLASPVNKRIEFFIRKSDGTVKSVELTKTVLEQEYNKVRSCILNGRIKVGYISLPSFYTQFEDNTHLGCANDVAKECIKLQKENISGIILDLRDNGGGSIHEAIDLSGLFIDYGPICITKEKNQKPAVLKDYNRGTAYSGPLIVLVNRQSASASEIVASALQDYNRAVIIGNNTYGKATGQVIIPCDTNPENTKNVNGFVKLTIEKVYRITGKSNQRVGLHPDINLPDIESQVIDGEINEKHALSTDSIKKSNFIPLPGLPKEGLKIMSLARLAKSQSFIKIQNICDSMKIFIEGSKNLPLNLNEFLSYYTKKKEIINILEKVFEKDNTDFKACPVNFNNTLKVIQTDEDVSFFNTAQKDMNVEEAFNVIGDMVGVKSK